MWQIKFPMGYIVTLGVRNQTQNRENAKNIVFIQAEFGSHSVEICGTQSDSRRVVKKQESKTVKGAGSRHESWSK